MAVRRKQYAQELERQLASGKKSLTKAHAAAAKKSIVKKAKKRSTWVSRLKRNVEMVIKGPKYYKSKKKKGG